MSGTLAMRPEVEVAFATDPGKDPDKQVNEDTCRCEETAFGYLVVLCDGMGGHEGGRQASEAAVLAVFRYVNAAAPRPDLPQAVRAREVLRDAIAVANRDVFALSAVESATRPGSTLVAALLHPYGTEVAHVGDSRCYLLHHGEIRQITHDHSMVQQLVDTGQITEAEAAAHPEANKITRALGVSPTVTVDVQPSSVMHAAGDAFVLCSDGLSDLVSAAEIAQAVAASAPAAAAHALVDLANERGGHDNVTVAILRVTSAALSFSDAALPVVRTTETMPAVPSSVARSQPTLDWQPPSSSPADSRPLLPPAPPVSRRPSRRARGRLPPAVLIGLILAVVGVAAVAAVVALQVAPQRVRNDVPGLSLSIVLPTATLAHGALTSDDDVDAGVDAGARTRRFHNPRRK